MALIPDGVLSAVITQREHVIIAKVETLHMSWALMRQVEENNLRLGLECAR
jgi:hypothetical protein